MGQPSRIPSSLSKLHKPYGNDMPQDKLYAFETTVRVANFIINALPLEDIIRGYCYLLKYHSGLVATKPFAFH
jgi:hypothetical protein